jgi:sporulation protein YabP
MAQETQGARPAGGRPNGHSLTIENRERMTVTGVLHVGSFDDRQIVLDTDLGTLTLTGEDLQIKQLDLDQGTFWVEGLVASVQYAARRAGGKDQAKGLIGKFFR